jgi:hypothetical protein
MTKREWTQIIGTGQSRIDSEDQLETTPTWLKQAKICTQWSVVGTSYGGRRNHTLLDPPTTIDGQLWKNFYHVSGIFVIKCTTDRQDGDAGLE